MYTARRSVTSEGQHTFALRTGRRGVFRESWISCSRLDYRVVTQRSTYCQGDSGHGFQGDCELWHVFDVCGGLSRTTLADVDFVWQLETAYVLGTVKCTQELYIQADYSDHLGLWVGLVLTFLCESEHSVRLNTALYFIVLICNLIACSWIYSIPILWVSFLPCMPKTLPHKA